jgi:predicted O-methyltransferase YrrM
MNFRSLRPSYIVPRLGQYAFARKHPDAPWLTATAVTLLDSWLRRSDVGIEWGSGRSTRWFAERVGRLTSIEDNEKWFENVSKRISELKNVDYRFIRCELCEQDEPASHPYADIADQLEPESLDFALVDGNIRLLCVEKAISKLKPGGLLIIDNANRYIPNRSLGKHSTIHEPRNEPRSPKWERLIKQLEEWRTILTSDGIWDTRMYVKPAGLPPKE